jgi:hypothetical protein
MICTDFAQRSPLMPITMATHTPMARQSMTTATKVPCKRSRSIGRRARIGGVGRGARDDVIAINRAAEARAARHAAHDGIKKWSASDKT